MFNTVPPEIVADTASVNVNYLDVGSYEFTAFLHSSDFMQTYGGFAYTFNITEDMDGKSLYVYLPKTIYFSSMTNTTEMANELARLGAVLEDCGISPISTVPFVQTSACVVG